VHQHVPLDVFQFTHGTSSLKRHPRAGFPATQYSPAAYGQYAVQARGQHIQGCMPGVYTPMARCAAGKHGSTAR
jgi:hypothetical protein